MLDTRCEMPTVLPFVTIQYNIFGGKIKAQKKKHILLKTSLAIIFHAYHKDLLSNGKPLEAII